MIKLIIFDLWKTLAYRDVPRESTAEMLEKTHSSLAPRDFVKLFERCVQTRKWKSKKAAYRFLCEHMDIPVTEENIRILMEIRETAEAQTKLFSYTLSLLKQLKQAGFKIGLLSNSSIFAIDQVKKKTELLDFIDYPLFSFEVGTIKPDPRFYELMLQKAKCKPEEALMIGDKRDDDVLPPKTLGIPAVHLHQYASPKNELFEVLES